jgi:hypothetical protein
MKRIAFALAFALMAALAFAVDIDLGVLAGASTETNNALWANFSGGFDAKMGGLEFLGALQARTDGTYGGFMDGVYGTGGVALYVPEGGIKYKGEGLSASLGKLAIEDIVDSPYSLFVSGRKNKALSASFGLTSGNFFYNDQWVALNYDSSGTYTSYDSATSKTTTYNYPDRSATIKSWGLKLGSFRVAMQDVAIYTNKVDIEAGSENTRGPIFDLDYFALPIPSVIVQYIGFDEDGPWAKVKRNDNSISGFMVDYTEGDWYAVAQILVDDINLKRFTDPDGTQNPDKIAWHLGARRNTEYGTFGLYHAGATKYTFEPYGNTTSNEMYGYTFYPDVDYEVSGTPMAIEPEADYVGYVHGENNLALMGTWRKAFGPLDAVASLEGTISGSKSPANPWHEYTHWKDAGSGTKLLDESVLEKKLLACGSVSMPAGAFEIGAELKLGYVWNRLKLHSVAAAVDSVNGISLFKPSDESAPIVEFVLGAKYHVTL